MKDIWKQRKFWLIQRINRVNRGRLCATIKVCKWEGWSLSNITDLQYFEPPVKLDCNESGWCWLRVGSKIGLILPTPTHPPTFIMRREWELSRSVCSGFGIRGINFKSCPRVYWYRTSSASPCGADQNLVSCFSNQPLFLLYPPLDLLSKCFYQNLVSCFFILFTMPCLFSAGLFLVS